MSETIFTIKEKRFMNLLEFEVWESNDAKELFDLADSNDDIDIVSEKNFSGDVTAIELYISSGINLLTVVIPIIITLIKKKKISKLKIDGDKLEIDNVSEELVEKVLIKKLGGDESNKNNSGVNNESN